MQASTPTESDRPSEPTWLVGVRMNDGEIRKYEVSAESWESATNTVTLALIDEHELPRAVLCLTPPRRPR